MPETPGPSEFGLTHAGGVVFRRAGNTLQYLLVSAKGNPDHWVLPKGHIQQGETPEAAATREVYEETGVVARIQAPVGELEFHTSIETVRALFFLMEYVSMKGSSEGRRLRWCSYDEGDRLLTFEDSRKMLRDGHVICLGLA